MSSRKIPLSVPVFQGREQELILEGIKDAWVSTGGPFVARFEQDLAQYLSSPGVVATASGTSALHVSLLECQVGEQDLVLAPTLTFIATINAIRYVGADPIFIDCDPYLNLDPQAVEEFLRIECTLKNDECVHRATGRKVRAIVPVHVFGLPADMVGLLEVAQKYGLEVIEDATESLGTYYTEGSLKGRMTGTIAKMGCLSFNGNKLITTGGGGAVLTRDPSAEKHIRYLTTQAKNDEIYFVHDEVGFNYRMTNLQAALGVAQLERIEKIIAMKRANFEQYRAELDGVPGLSWILEPPGCRSNYWFYTLLVDSDQFGLGRDQMLRKLGNQGIQTRPVWHLNHRQKPYLTCPRGSLKRAEDISQRILNLPCSVNLSKADIQWISACIRELKK